MSGFLGAPTSVSLAGVRATRTGVGVRVTWSSASESGVLGYRVYREAAGQRVPITKRLIPAASGTGYHRYHRVDRAAPRATVRYWVEEVRLDGSRTLRGPALAR